MSFESVERSQEDGKPYEKYRFQYGPGADDCYKYTNAIEDLSDFLATPIKREVYRTSGKAERDQLQITLPADSDLGNLILPYPVPQPVEVTIWQGHFDTTPDMVIWVGRVLSNAYVKKEVQLSCESTLISLKRLGLRRRWQFGCPYPLYGQGCFADRDAFTTEATIVSITDGVPTFAAGWEGPFVRGKFVGGMIQWQSPYGREFRMIRDVTTTRVLFNGVIRGMEPGDTVKLILGCNHKMNDCLDTFDNIANFGGDPWIPYENPVRHPNFW